MALELIEYDAQYLDGLIPLWREAFEYGVGVTDPHPLAEQRDYFLAQVLPQNRVTLALLDGQLAGFVASSQTVVAQLFVRVGLHRQGIGSTLLELAKSRAAGSLSLYTFARNTRACSFYLKHGFVEIERGFEAHWQLEDVLFRWPAPA